MSLVPRDDAVSAEITCGCDLANSKRQDDPDNPIWLHRRGCAFWTPEQDWARPMWTAAEVHGCVFYDECGPDLTDDQRQRLLEMPSPLSGTPGHTRRENGLETILGPLEARILRYTTRTL